MATTTAGTAELFSARRFLLLLFMNSQFLPLRLISVCCSVQCRHSKMSAETRRKFTAAFKRQEFAEAQGNATALSFTTAALPVATCQNRSCFWVRCPYCIVCASPLSHSAPLLHYRMFKRQVAHFQALLLPTFHIVYVDTAA